MSTFKVEVVRINSVNPHPNAERLDIATFEGMAYQVITAKGNFQLGDLAFYFPIDRVIPNAFLDEFGIRLYYSKKLRAAKLRGIFSEGLLIPVGEDFKGTVGDDYTEHFGVTKYQYPIPQNMSGDVEAPIGLTGHSRAEPLFIYLCMDTFIYVHLLTTWNSDVVFDRLKILRTYATGTEPILRGKT